MNRNSASIPNIRNTTSEGIHKNEYGMFQKQVAQCD